MAKISHFLLYRAGPNMWRDDQLPCDILDWYCDRHGIERPVFEGSERVRFNGRTYTLNEFGESCMTHCNTMYNDVTKNCNSC